MTFGIMLSIKIHNIPSGKNKKKKNQLVAKDWFFFSPAIPLHFLCVHYNTSLIIMNYFHLCKLTQMVEMKFFTEEFLIHT